MSSDLFKPIPILRNCRKFPGNWGNFWGPKFSSWDLNPQVVSKINAVIFPGPDIEAVCCFICLICRPHQPLLSWRKNNKYSMKELELTDIQFKPVNFWCTFPAFPSMKPIDRPRKCCPITEFPVILFQTRQVKVAFVKCEFSRVYGSYRWLHILTSVPAPMTLKPSKQTKKIAGAQRFSWWWS